MRKREGSTSIESYLFFQQQSRQAVSNARSSKHNRYSTCSAPPLPNFHRQSEWQGCSNCEFRHIKKKSDFPSSYHHRQRRRKGSGTHTFVKLCSKHTQNGELHDVTRRCAFHTLAIQTARGNAIKNLRLQRIGPGIPCSVTNASAF